MAKRNLDGWIVALTGDCVFITVTLTDANKEGAIFVLGGQQQFLSFHAVYVPVVPPAQREDKMEKKESVIIGVWSNATQGNTLSMTNEKWTKTEEEDCVS